MSGFGYYAERARESAAQIAELERALETDPTNRALQINLASARRFFLRIDEQYKRSAIIAQQDVVRYRIIQDSKPIFTLSDLTKSLGSFQEALSYLYDSLVNGPRNRGRLPAEIRDDTTIGFAYSFQGSLGVVLSVPNKKDLFGGRLDQVVITMEDFLALSSADEVRDVARKLGRSAVQRMYEWSSANSRAGYDLDLKWISAGVRDRAQYIPNSQFSRIAEVIGVTSEMEETQQRIHGVLVGINTTKKTFHFVVPDGDSFAGNLATEFPATRQWSVNKQYIAVIQTSRSVRLATGQETQTHFLVSLDDDKSSALGALGRRT